MISGFSVRLAQQSDAETFVGWSVNNGAIPKRDIVASMPTNNPTSVVLVVEKDGKPVLFIPVYCQMTLAYLGFNPDTEGRDRLHAMSVMQDALKWWASEHGIQEITVQTAKDYPVAKWALKHGFEEEPRQTFKLRVTPVVSPFEDKNG